MRKSAEENHNFYKDLVNELNRPLTEPMRTVGGADNVGQALVNACNILPTDGLKDVKLKLLWGTFGEEGTKPLAYVRLVDCSSDHLLAIMRRMRIGPCYQLVIKEILRDRGYSEEQIDDGDYKPFRFIMPEVRLVIPADEWLQKIKDLAWSNDLWAAHK